MTSEGHKEANPGAITWWMTQRHCGCVVSQTRLLGGRRGILGSVRAAHLLCLWWSQRGNGTDVVQNGTVFL